MEKLSTKYSKAIALGCALLVAGASIPAMNFGTETVEAAETYNYAKGLQYSMYFYDANMCGTEVGETSALDWRDDCHTDDAKVSTSYGTLDLSGGYHDAGDHVKFGLPQAYSASMLGWGYYEFKDAYTSTGQSSHMQTISQYFADYFKNCTVLDSSGNVTAFCYQVGDGDTDHSEWCSPEDQNIDRPVQFATSSNPATDIVCNTVGALAFNYKNFGDTESLTYAKALYKFAKNNSKQIASQGIGSFYVSDSYIDDLMWSAAALYVATGDKTYISDANTFLSDSGNSYAFCSDWPLCWGNMWPAVNLIFGKVGSGISSQYGDVTAQMMEQVEKTMTSFQSKTTLDGTYVCFDDWGSARYNTAMQLVGLVYDKYNNTSKYTSWAKTQMDYLMGNNSKNLCYITGFADNSVTNPHHRAASGLSTFPTENTTITMGNTLIGALVGGPMKDGSYLDQVSQYKYTEVAIDYNAGFVGAMAGLYLKYGSGQSVDSSIKGVSNGGSTTTTTTTVTTPKETTSVTSSSSVTTSKSSTTTTPTVTTSPIVTSQDIVTSKVNETISNGGSLTIPINSIVKDGDKVLSINVDMSSVNGNNIGTMNGQITIDTEDSQLTGNLTSINSSSGTIAIEIPSGTNLNLDGNITINVWWSECGTINIDNVSATLETETSQTSITTVPTSTGSTTSSNTTTSIATVEDTINVNVNKPINPTVEGSNTYNTPLSDLLPEGSTLESLTFTITSNNGNIGGINGGFGISVTEDCPYGEDYWYNDTEGYSTTVSGNSVEVTWTIPDSIKPYIDRDGVVMLGVWWADCGEVTLKSVTSKVSTQTIITESTITSTSSSDIDETTKATTTSNTQVTTTVSSVDQSTTSSTTSTSTEDLVWGDVTCDGNVKSNDLLLLKKYLLGVSSLPEQALKNSDVTHDGKVATNDLLKLKKFLLGLISASDLAN